MNARQVEARRWYRQAQSDLDVVRTLRLAGHLDQFYIPTRYPNGLPSPAVPGEAYTETQAATAQEAADRVLAAAGAFLGTLAGGTTWE